LDVIALLYDAETYFLLQANTTLTSLDLAANALCGIDFYGNGEYNADGIIALADSLKVSYWLSQL
jgi:hypothetical protein